MASALMATSAPLKPFSFSSPQRASPFRRPESPASPSPLRNSSAVIPSQSAAIAARSAAQSLRPSTAESSSPSLATTSTPKLSSEKFDFVERHHTPTEPTTSIFQSSNPRTLKMGISETDAMSKLQPAQLRELREGYQILDRDSDGLVNGEDVADILTQLGLPANTSDISKFFPKGQAQNITLPTFLTQISTLQAALSPPAELLSAFSAFDDDDSGQADLKELREALLRTAPDPGEQALTEREVDRILNSFSGRRTFAKKSEFTSQKRGETFKYEAFVSAIAGSNDADKESQV